MPLSTINIGSACTRIHWAGGLFGRANPSPLDLFEHFDDLRRVLDVADGVLLQLLAVSATAIMQPRDLLKIRRWAWVFMNSTPIYYEVCSWLRMYLLAYENFTVLMML